VSHLTLDTFSTENWSRSRGEVENLFELLVKYIDSETMELLASGVRLSAVGDLGRLPRNALDSLREAERLTADNATLTLTLALSYGSRTEIASAARDLARKARAGRIDPDSIDEAAFAGQMWSAHLPDVDLLIRTGGEKRISNFLLWRVAYAELHFTDTLWPDFGEADFLTALADFRSRQRRFGLAGEAASP
jgi:undecaprenyl diphosphate synthase